LCNAIKAKTNITPVTFAENPQETGIARGKQNKFRGLEDPSTATQHW
jgi:hypothetical protein